MNVDYVAEVFAGDYVCIVSRLVEHDHKRVHGFQEMRHEGRDSVAATNEILAMQVDMTMRKSAPFPSDVHARLVENEERARGVAAAARAQPRDPPQLDLGVPHADPPER